MFIEFKWYGCLSDAGQFCLDQKTGQNCLKGLLRPCN